MSLQSAAITQSRSIPGHAARPLMGNSITDSRDFVGIAIRLGISRRGFKAPSCEIRDPDVDSAG